MPDLEYVIDQLLYVELVLATFAVTTPIIGLIVAIFGFVIIYLGHRSRPTKEKKMLKMQAEEYLKEQKLKNEMEKREIEEMKRAEKERKKE